jgi:hypothetical protein
MNAKAVLAVGFLVVVTIAGVMWSASRGQGGSAQAGIKPPIRVDRTEVEISKFLTELTPQEAREATEDAVRGMMDATSIAERLEWARPVSGLRERMEVYYSREGGMVDMKFGSFVDVSPVAFEGVPMEVVIATGKGAETNFPFTVLPGSDRMLVDWDSSVAFGEMSWDKLLAERPTQAVQMRVFLESSDYYNYEFADDRRYACYRLTSRGSEDNLYGFVERGSESALRLERTMQASASMPMNVRIKFPENTASKNFVVIDEIIHPYWVDVSSLVEASGN